MADEWRSIEPDRTVTVLRPVVGMAADSTVGLAAALAAGMGQRVGEDDPPAQFLHLDDLASAVVLAAENASTVSSTSHPTVGSPASGYARSPAAVRVRLPDRVTEVIGNLRWRFQRGPIPPGSAQLHPLAMAGRQRPAEGAGLGPTVTNEQAYVEGTEAKWWTMVTPKRRQELSLMSTTSRPSARRWMPPSIRPC